MRSLRIVLKLSMILHQLYVIFRSPGEDQVQHSNLIFVVSISRMLETLT